MSKELFNQQFERVLIKGIRSQETDFNNRQKELRCYSRSKTVIYQQALTKANTPESKSANQYTNR